MLGCMFSCEESVVSDWLNLVLDYHHANDVFLVRSRNLSQPNNISEVLQEARDATVRHEIACAMYEPIIANYLANNPNHIATHGALWAVVICFDSQTFQIMKSRDFHKQQLSFSSKTHANGLNHVCHSFHTISLSVMSANFFLACWCRS